jgi:hypothetical protein
MTAGAVVVVVWRVAVVADDPAGVVVAGVVLAGSVAVAGGSVAGDVSGASAGLTAGTVVLGDVDVLEAATPASTPTLATPPAAMNSVRLPTRAQPASRWAGVRGELVTPTTLADPCKSRTSRR